MAQPSFGQLTQLFCSFCSGKYDEVRGAGYDGPIHAYLCDFAMHHLDLARWLGGEVRRRASITTSGTAGAPSPWPCGSRTAPLAISSSTASGSGGATTTGSRSPGEGEHILIDGLWGYRHFTSGDNTFSDNYSDERSTELGGDGPALIEFVTAIREGRPSAQQHPGRRRHDAAVPGDLRRLSSRTAGSTGS